MPAKVICPHCSNDRAYVHKKPNPNSRFTHYRCTNCKRVWSESGLPAGTQPQIKDRPLTARELTLRHRPLSVHYQVPNKEKGYTACGMVSSRDKSKLTNDTDKVTCKLCLKTNVYLENSHKP